jgi:hypothetical protein
VVFGAKSIKIYICENGFYVSVVFCVKSIKIYICENGFYVSVVFAPNLRVLQVRTWLMNFGQ